MSEMQIMPPKKASEKKALLKRPPAARPSAREPFPEDASRDSHSAILLPWLVGLVVLEWLFLLGFFSAGLWLWSDWALLSWAPLVWLHVGLLTAISVIRQFGQWAYAFLPMVHSAIIAMAIIDSLVVAAFATTAADWTVTDTVIRMACLVAFALFGWIRVCLVLFCTGQCVCCKSRRTSPAVSV